MTADTTEVVALRIEEETLEHAAGILDGWGIARAELAVDVLEGLLLVAGGITLERLDNGVVVLGVDDLDGGMTRTNEIADDGRRQGLVSTCDNGVTFTDVAEQDLGPEFLLLVLGTEVQLLNLVEECRNLLVGRVTEGAEEGGGEKLTTALAAVEIDVEEVVGVELNFGPGSAVGNDAEAVQELAIEMDIGLEADAG